MEPAARILVDESDLLLESLSLELKDARTDSAKIARIGEGVEGALQRLSASVEGGVESWTSSNKEMQENIVTELQGIKNSLESIASMIKEMKSETEQKLSSQSFQQIQINQFAFAHSTVNSFKYYESLKDIQKSFKYSLAIGKKDSAALVNNILLTFNQGRGYYIHGYLDDGTINHKYPFADMNERQFHDFAFSEEDLSFMRLKFQEALRTQIHELTGREPTISAEQSGNAVNWCIFQN